MRSSLALSIASLAALLSLTLGDMVVVQKKEPIRYPMKRVPIKSEKFRKILETVKASEKLKLKPYHPSFEIVQNLGNGRFLGRFYQGEV